MIDPAPRDPAPRDPAPRDPAHKQVLTASELAKLRGVSPSYICRLCRLPSNHPKYIQNIKINPQLYWITDKAILAEYPERYYFPF